MEDLEIQKVEFGYLSNPQRISELAKRICQKIYFIISKSINIR